MASLSVVFNNSLIFSLSLSQENQVSIDVDIDHRVHNRLIGSRGRYIRDIMKKFNVDVKFPRPADSNPNLVTIAGEEDNCYDCKDELLNLEEEFVSLAGVFVPSFLV